MCGKTPVLFARLQISPIERELRLNGRFSRCEPMTKFVRRLASNHNSIKSPSTKEYRHFRTTLNVVECSTA